MFEEVQLKQNKKPNCLRKTYFTANPIWIICSICVLTIVQTGSPVSSFHLGLARDATGVINILIQSASTLDIGIIVNSTNSSIEISDKNESIFKLDRTMEQIMKTTTDRGAIDSTVQTTSNHYISILDDTTEKLSTTTMKTNPDALFQHTIWEDDQNEAKRLLKILYRRSIRRDTIRPLAIAAERCEQKTAEFLIENGADVNEVGKGGWCPIHVATYNDCKEIVKMLIENGADINAKIRLGYSALDIADVYGYGEIVQLLSDSVVEGGGRQHVNEVTYEEGDDILV